MTKMRAPPQPVAVAPTEKFPYAAALGTVLIIAILAVLIVQSGAIETLNHSALLR